MSEFSIFKRKGRKGVTLQYRDLSGKLKQRSFRTRSLAQDEALRLHQTPDPGDREETVRDYATRWLVRVQPGLRSGSYEMYRWAIKNHVTPMLGDLKLVHLRQAHIKDFLSGKLKGGLEKKSVRNIKQALHACLAEAADDKLIATNPASFRKGSMKWLQTSKSERKPKVKAFDAAQLRLLLATATDALPQYATLLRTMAMTGLRLGEALALQWDDFDWKRRTVTVSRGFTRGRIEPTKSGDERTVDLPAGPVEELRGLDVEAKRRAFAAGAPRAPWVFPSRVGTPIDHGYVEKGFKRVLKVAGLPPHFTPHCLRHTYACLQLTAGVSIYYVQRMLGHATIQMTVDLYGHWLPAGNQRAADGLESAVRGATDNLLTADLEAE